MQMPLVWGEIGSFWKPQLRVLQWDSSLHWDHHCSLLLLGLVAERQHCYSLVHFHSIPSLGHSLQSKGCLKTDFSQHTEIPTQL